MPAPSWPVSLAIGDGLVALAGNDLALLTIAFISRPFASRERAAGDAPSGCQQLVVLFPATTMLWLSASYRGSSARCCCSAPGVVLQLSFIPPAERRAMARKTLERRHHADSIYRRWQTPHQPTDICGLGV